MSRTLVAWLAFSWGTLALAAPRALLKVETLAIDNYEPGAPGRGKPVHMYLTIRRPDQTVVAAGWGPLKVRLPVGSTYTLSAASFRNFVFHQWEDASPAATRSFNLESARTLTAYYFTQRGAIWGLYLAPTSSPGVLSNAWRAVRDAKLRHPRTPVMVVVNPCNGPDRAASEDFSFGIDQLRRAGVVVAGYVYTKYGKTAGEACTLGPPGPNESSCVWTQKEAPQTACTWRPWDTPHISASTGVGVKQDIDQWADHYPAFNPTTQRYGINALFFDEMHYSSAFPNDDDAGAIRYYKHTLMPYARRQGFRLVIGNPGADPSPEHIGAADILLVYENRGLPGAVYPPPGDWKLGYDRHNFGVIPYGVPTFTSEVAAWVRRTSAGIGYIYVTDDNDNPWDTVSSYLGDLLETLECAPP